MMSGRHLLALLAMASLAVACSSKPASKSSFLQPRVNDASATDRATPDGDIVSVASSRAASSDCAQADRDADGAKACAEAVIEELEAKVPEGVPVEIE